MRKLALILTAAAGLGFAAPALATENTATQGRIQLAQAGISVSVGERPAVRSRTVVRGDRHHHRNWRAHRAHSDRVVVVKRKPARKTVIITR